MLLAPVALAATLLIAQAPVTEATAPGMEEGAPAAATDGVGASVDELQGEWVVRAGGSASLTEGNSSTRAYGASLNGNYEGAVHFTQLDGFAQYGLTRQPSRRPIPDGASEAERAGRPGTEFDENINNWSARGKHGTYLSASRSQYLYVFSSLEGDTFRGFWWRYEVQGGYGRRLSNERLTFKAELGPSFTEERLIVGRFRSRLAVALNLMADFRINAHLVLREELTHMRTVASNDLDTAPFAEHRTRSKSDVNISLTERFHLQLSALFEHASNPSPGAHPLDTRFTTSIIYSFL